MDKPDVVINKTLKSKDRNQEITMRSPVELMGDVEVVVQRQVIVYDEPEEGKPIEPIYIQGTSRSYVVNKKLSEIINETITLPVEAGGITLTAGQIALAVEMLSDKFAE